MPGPAVTLSFLLGAVACAFAGLCYAEMASTVPISGSAYTYAYATLGELVAWIIGWDLILEYAVGAIAVAIGWSGYVVSLAGDLGLVLPARFVSAPISFDAAEHAWSSTGAILNVPAVLIIVMITALLVVGIRESAKFNNFIVAVKLTVIALFIVCAAPSFSTANWVTSGNPAGAFIPPNAGYRHLWLVGRAPWRRRGILCLYRVRCRLDGGAGSQGPDAGYAQRHSGIAGDLRGAVRRGRLCPHRDRAVRPAQRSRSDRGRDRCRRDRLAFAADQAGDRVRTDLGHSGDASRPAKNLSRHGP